MIRALIVGVALGGVLQPAWATTEQQGSSMEQSTSTTPASPPQTQVAGSPTPAMPTPAMPAKVMPFEIVRGSITALDLAAVKPSLKLSEANGKDWTFALDSKATLVLREGKIVQLNQLKMGQSVEVRHAAVGGKDLAQSIRIVSAKPIASSTEKPHSSY